MTVQRSINLRFEPGRQICTSYIAEDIHSHAHLPHLHHQHIAPRQDVRAVSGTPMDLNPPKQNAEWSGLVGNLFDVAAEMVNNPKRESVKSEERESPKPPKMSTALWPRRAWQAVSKLIWGQELADSKTMYTMDIPYFPQEIWVNFSHATLAVVVEVGKSIVGVFGANEEVEEPQNPQFIEHAKIIKHRVSLKTLAKVLGTPTLITGLTVGKLAVMQAKTHSAEESIKMVEDLVDRCDGDNTIEPIPPVNPRKRRFEEIDNDTVVNVKTERSMSSELGCSASSHSSLSNGRVKMEYESTNTIDEETTNAASILNDVAMNRRQVCHLYGMC